jgi:hypothetical protein
MLSKSDPIDFQPAQDHGRFNVGKYQQMSLNGYQLQVASHKFDLRIAAILHSILAIGFLFGPVMQHYTPENLFLDIDSTPFLDIFKHMISDIS